MAAGVRLRDLLALPSLQEARVVAGEAGLDRPVRHVNVMEVPDILRWVNPDELLLTTAYPLRNDPSALTALVPGLADRGLAGLAVKPARYIDAIPAEMLAVADELQFPLIELPLDSSFNEIINSVLTVILNAQAVRLQRTADIHERFTAIVLGGGGLPQIADALADAIGVPVAIVDAQARVQTVSDGAPDVATLGTRLPIRIDDDTNRRRAEAIGGSPVVVQPIAVSDERFGAIVAMGVDELADDQTDALEYAATIAALRQVQARVIAEADRRFQSICLEELVTGHVARAALMERAVAFKWDLSVPRAVLITAVDEIGARPFARLAGRPEEASVRRRLADAVRAGLGRGAIVWERSAEVAALVPADDGGDPRVADGARRLLAEARRALPDATISIGVGRAVGDPLRLNGSFAEARQALDAGRQTRGPGRVTAFAELGVDRLLSALPEAELTDFSSSILRPLVEHDARRDTNLVGTLEAFLETRNAAAAARQMWIHYNTMKNRLRLIEELIGGSLDEGDRVLELGLALRIRRMARG